VALEEEDHKKVFKRKPNKVRPKPVFDLDAITSDFEDDKTVRKSMDLREKKFTLPFFTE